ncbi:MAG TPA: dTDP-4-dehydrorhamnose 3,5-epimerase [Magnetospirillum sp.]|jgi:dTDP-4-dehydrorhamnose 3,5-epimerase|nr:dTDP-4-dehydrorhamnose 3,5-epimerase [Magnetospirillum sp.]
MDITPTEIPNVLIVRTRWFGDMRGSFSEVYNRRAWQEAGLDVDFCQDNHAISGTAGTVRGLHFQRPPSAQAKLVRVVRGAVLDVAVDIRAGSPWYGRWVAVELSADNRTQLFVPRGFAHGYCTLTPDTEVLYKVDNFYDPGAEDGVLWNDPTLGIPWPETADPTTVNARDGAWPTLSRVTPCFHYEADR